MGRRLGPNDAKNVDSPNLFLPPQKRTKLSLDSAPKLNIKLPVSPRIKKFKLNSQISSLTLDSRVVDDVPTTSYRASKILPRPLGLQSPKIQKVVDASHRVHIPPANLDRTPPPPPPPPVRFRPLSTEPLDRSEDLSSSRAATRDLKRPCGLSSPGMHTPRLRPPRPSLRTIVKFAAPAPDGPWRGLLFCLWPTPDVVASVDFFSWVSANIARIGGGYAYGPTVFPRIERKMTRLLAASRGAETVPKTIVHVCWWKEGKGALSKAWDAYLARRREGAGAEYGETSDDSGDHQTPPLAAQLRKVDNLMKRKLVDSPLRNYWDCRHHSNSSLKDFPDKIVSPIFVEWGREANCRPRIGESPFFAPSPNFSPAEFRRESPNLKIYIFGARGPRQQGAGVAPTQQQVNRLEPRQPWKSGHFGSLDNRSIMSIIGYAFGAESLVSRLPELANHEPVKKSIAIDRLMRMKTRGTWDTKDELFVEQLGLDLGLSMSSDDSQREMMIDRIVERLARDWPPVERDIWLERGRELGRSLPSVVVSCGRVLLAATIAGPDAANSRSIASSLPTNEARGLITRYRRFFSCVLIAGGDVVQIGWLERCYSTGHVESPWDNRAVDFTISFEPGTDDLIINLFRRGDVPTVQPAVVSSRPAVCIPPQAPPPTVPWQIRDPAKEDRSKSLLFGSFVFVSQNCQDKIKNVIFSVGASQILVGPLETYFLLNLVVLVLAVLNLTISRPLSLEIFERSLSRLKLDGIFIVESPNAQPAKLALNQVIEIILKNLGLEDKLSDPNDDSPNIFIFASSLDERRLVSQLVTHYCRLPCASEFDPILLSCPNGQPVVVERPTCPNWFDFRAAWDSIVKSELDVLARASSMSQHEVLIRSLDESRRLWGPLAGHVDELFASQAVAGVATRYAYHAFVWSEWLTSSVDRASLVGGLPVVAGLLVSPQHLAAVKLSSSVRENRFDPDEPLPPPPQFLRPGESLFSQLLNLVDDNDEGLGTTDPDEPMAVIKYFAAPDLDAILLAESRPRSFEQKWAVECESILGMINHQKMSR